jgi:peptidoglycan/LPS O-acetylase OafA/YrhL
MVKTAPAVESPAASTYNYAIGYLRAFIVLLVVAHHAALAYLPLAPAPPSSLVAQPRWWQAFPVVDPKRGDWASVLTGFNDIFFMSLLFLMSGLFVSSGLKRKGAAAFLRGRLLRLGLPFVVAVALVSPLAYYPAYLQTTAHSDFAGFVRQWFSLGSWPSGPAWFIWVLLAFDCIGTLLFRTPLSWKPGPARLFIALVGASTVTYVPLELIFTSFHWTAFGPFTFQTSRILHYLVYFLAGAALGEHGVDSKLARRWVLWVISAIVAFLAASAAAIAYLTGNQRPESLRVTADVLFSVSCAASCFALLALFLRFAQSRSSVFDRLAPNSYGIYLVHYAFVSWLQLALVGARMPSVVKFAFVLSSAVSGSWITTVAIRRIPGVARVV